jgi:hypothetical protein
MLLDFVNSSGYHPAYLRGGLAPTFFIGFCLDDFLLETIVGIS